MKFYDRMMAHPLTQRDIRRHQEIADRPRGDERVIAPGIHALPEAVVIDATNVATYYHDHYGWGLPDRLEDFVPSIAPPFPSAWFEVRTNRSMQLYKTCDAYGALCHSIDLWEYAGDLKGDERQRWSNRAAQNIANQTTRGMDGAELDFDIWPMLDSDVRWVSYWWNYMLVHGGKILGPVVEVRVFITPEGNIANLKGSDKIAAISRAIALEDHGDEASENALRASTVMLNPFWLAIGFCHCKNVVPVEGEMPPKKVRAKQEKKLGAPLAKFYTLEIDPMKRVLREEGQIEKTGLKRALHICRGHFATYTEDKPLFGRVTGTFWRPAHVRGTAEVGAIGKQYAVKPPKA